MIKGIVVKPRPTRHKDTAARTHKGTLDKMFPDTIVWVMVADGLQFNGDIHIRIILVACIYKKGSDEHAILIVLLEDTKPLFCPN